jgi:hypothetical protein
VIDPGLIKSAVVKQIYEYWSGKRVGERLPRRSDINPLELKGLASFVFMIDVVYDPLRFKMRFFGTQLVQWAGYDYTGFVIGESERGPWRQIFDDYRTVVETRAPRFDERHAEWPGREFRLYERIVAPLSADSHAIDMLFGALHTRPSA